MRILHVAAVMHRSVDDSRNMKNAHAMITALEDDLFELAEKLELLLGPVMDAIHQLEADHPTLSFDKPLWTKLKDQFAQFSIDNPELSTGQLPADKQIRNPTPTAISLDELLEQDRIKMWHPAMDAASLLDAVFWQKNARQLYHVPVASLDMNVRCEVEGFLEGFAKADEQVAVELTELEVDLLQRDMKRCLTCSASGQM
jgi:hypothetical protein